MKIYTVIINKRNCDSEFVLCLSKEVAIDWVKRNVKNRYSKESISANLKDFGGDLERGEYYSEEEDIHIAEKEVI